MPAALHLAIRQAMHFLDVGVMGQAMAKPLHLRSMRAQFFLKKLRQLSQTSAPYHELLTALAAWHTTQKGITLASRASLALLSEVLSIPAALHLAMRQAMQFLDVGVMGQAVAKPFTSLLQKSFLLHLRSTRASFLMKKARQL